MNGMGIHLGTVPHPARSGVQAAFFPGLDSAVDHLCRHVLSHPESDGWLLVAPALADEAGLCDEEGRHQARLAVLRHEQELTGRLVGLYRRACEVAAGDAFLLGWHVSDGAVTVALGTSGTFFLIEARVLTTAYLPGLGSPEAVRASGEGGHPAAGRERRLMRRDRGGRGHVPEARRRREQNWTAEERLYYCVFRPAVQHIRSRHHRAHELDGGRRDDIALLNRVLPRMSCLTLELWQEHRRRVAPGGDV